MPKIKPKKKKVKSNLTEMQKVKLQLPKKDIELQKLYDERALKNKIYEKENGIVEIKSDPKKKKRKKKPIKNEKFNFKELIKRINKEKE